ncbi:MAG: hypothetical protein F4X18_01545 [Acidimicrobiia bacterium]|nr:hypothetical protein [Acidimicrobiia bacterium]MYC84183.1 hypothetical protein [Acidimicrobiia bacterium]
MTARIIPLLLITSLLLVLGSPAAGDEPGGRIEIIEISGNLDRPALNFVSDRVEAAASGGATAAIIQLDSRATLSAAVVQLAARIADPPLPLVVWVGPAPASAFGGAARLLAAAPIKAAAPGVRIGYSQPVIAGNYPRHPVRPGPLEDLTESAFTVAEPTEGLVEIVAPSISNLLVELDGRTVEVRDSLVTLRTLRTTEDGAAAIETVFYEPSIGVRLLQLATGVEAAFFFLVAGLAVVVFEFYALGPGIAAAVAALMLLISGYGLAVLPLRGWAVGLALAAVWFLTTDLQRGRAGPLTGLGALAMLVSGLYFTDAAPQIRPSWWIVTVITVSVTAFYVIGIRTVARARFSTPTMGRRHLIGRSGVAVTRFDPDGVVEVEGARWQATAHREAGLGPGDPVVVRGVDGPILEVDPLIQP